MHFHKLEVHLFFVYLRYNKMDFKRVLLLLII